MEVTKDSDPHISISEKNTNSSPPSETGKLVFGLFAKTPIVQMFYLRRTSKSIRRLIGPRARFWQKLEVLLLDNYLTLCMFTKSSIEGIDMFTFCRIYTSNWSSNLRQKIQHVLQKKIPKKTGGKWDKMVTQTFDYRLCYKNVLFRYSFVPSKTRCIKFTKCQSTLPVIILT